MANHNAMPPGEALALAASQVGEVAGVDSILSEMNTGEDGTFVSTTIIWEDKSGSILQTATVLADGSVVL